MQFLVSLMDFIMARVTVEDCAEIVQSRFELVALAAQRAKKICAGGEVTIERDNDKEAVIALREIAQKTIDPDILRENLLLSLQKNVSLDEFGVEKDDGSDVEVADEAKSEAYEEVSSYVRTNEVIDEDNIYGGNDIQGED